MNSNGEKYIIYFLRYMDDINIPPKHSLFFTPQIDKFVR